MLLFLPKKSYRTQMCYITNPKPRTDRTDRADPKSCTRVALVNHRVIKDYIYEIESVGGYIRTGIDAQDKFMGLSSHEIEWCGLWGQRMVGGHTSNGGGRVINGGSQVINCGSQVINGGSQVINGEGQVINPYWGSTIEIIVCHWDWRDVRHPVINGKLFDDGSSNGIFNGLISYTNPIEMMTSYIFGELKIPAFFGGMLFGPIISSLKAETRHLDLFFILPPINHPSKQDDVLPKFFHNGWIECRYHSINGYVAVPGFKPIQIGSTVIIVFRHPQHKTKVYIVPPAIGESETRWFDGINLIWDRPVAPSTSIFDDYLRCSNEAEEI